MTTKSDIARLAHECELQVTSKIDIYGKVEWDAEMREQVAAIITRVLTGADLLQSDHSSCNAEAVVWLKKVYAMGVSEGSVVPQQNAGEMMTRLDELGFGKQDGRRGNTLHAMVMDAADEIEKLRGADLYAAGIADAREAAMNIAREPR